MTTGDRGKAESFRWTMEAGTGVVRAVRPNGQVLTSLGDHSFSLHELTQMHVQARNAHDFISRINASVEDEEEREQKRWHQHRPL